MTWQNATFVVTGVGLMALLEWARHRIDSRWDKTKVRNALLVLGYLLVVTAGVVVTVLGLRAM